MASFYVNGQLVTAEKNQKLLRFLRDELRLTSVKDGCSEGACGTCHVLIDGKATKACVPSTDKLEGHRIITVEGLSDREKEVYTWAFGKAGAVQCGFCIPGMVISAKALLDVNPEPTREEAAFAIRNNICRCTGYKKIIDAILLAAEAFRSGRQIPQEEGCARVGEAMPRIDAQEKVLGTGKYPDDIYLDGMLYGSAVRSKYPRARVLAIHKEKAEALPGVVGVYTAEDIPGQVKVGHLMQDWDAMIPVGKITHYLGDAICLVAAETPEILEKAKKLVEVLLNRPDQVSFVTNTVTTNQTEIVFFKRVEQPIHIDDGRRTVLIEYYGIAQDMRVFNPYFECNAYKGNNTVYVVDRDGLKIFNSQSDEVLHGYNTFTVLKNMQYLHGSTFEQAKQALARNSISYSNAILDGTEYYYALYQMEDSDWTLLFLVPSSYVAENTVKLVNLSVRTVLIFAIFL